MDIIGVLFTSVDFSILATVLGLFCKALSCQAGCLNDQILNLHHAIGKVIEKGYYTILPMIIRSRRLMPAWVVTPTASC